MRKCARVDKGREKWKSEGLLVEFFTFAFLVCHRMKLYRIHPAFQLTKPLKITYELRITLRSRNCFLGDSASYWRKGTSSFTGWKTPLTLEWWACIKGTWFMSLHCMHPSYLYLYSQFTYENVICSFFWHTISCMLQELADSTKGRMKKAASALESYDFSTCDDSSPVLSRVSSWPKRLQGDDVIKVRVSKDQKPVHVHLSFPS